MAASTNAVIVASAGVVTLTSGAPATFDITWGSNISFRRYSRVWPGIMPASDEDIDQSVTVVSEASVWSSDESASPHRVTLLGKGHIFNVVTARLQVLSSQVDTF